MNDIERTWFVVVKQDEGRISKGDFYNTSPKLYRHKKVAENNSYVRRRPDEYKVLAVKIVQIDA